jgi:hypothetical protein
LLVVSATLSSQQFDHENRAGAPILVGETRLRPPAMCGPWGCATARAYNHAPGNGRPTSATESSKARRAKFLGITGSRSAPRAWFDGISDAACAVHADCSSTGCSGGLSCGGHTRGDQATGSLRDTRPRGQTRRPRRTSPNTYRLRTTTRHVLETRHNCHRIAKDPQANRKSTPNVCCVRNPGIRPRSSVHRRACTSTELPAPAPPL